MAIHATSTTAPALQPRLLRPFAFRPVSPVDDPRSATELLEEIRRTIEGQEVFTETGKNPSLLKSGERVHLPPEPLLPPALPSLTSAFSRRRAIFGAVALAAAPAVALPAVAHSKPSMSPEAAAPRAEFDRVSADYASACREADEAVERIAYPEAPEALYWRKGDTIRLGFRAPEKQWSDSRFWYGEKELVEDLRSAPFRWLSGRRDDEGADRRDEIVETWDRWQASKRAVEDACGYTAAATRVDVAEDAYTGFLSRLIEMRTSDPDIMTLKAHVVLKTARGTEGLDRMVTAAQDADGVRQEAVAMSLVRDFIGQMGAVSREVAL